MADSALPKSGDIVAGKYRVERMLGMGGMGAVFEVTHRVTGRRFAVKWLLATSGAQDDAARRFIREAQVAGRFEHPNVVEVYDVGQERGSFYMVMELLEGESLAARLAEAKRLSYVECCRLLLPCLRGVARAHAAGIVHRDLKPANIFLCRATADSGEFAKVLDFGISKMSNAAGEVDSSLTKTGMVMGTPHYMSPEQVRGRSVDHRADIYAFGVILYELLSGELPFPADTYSELVLQIATETPKPLGQLVQDLPAGLVRVVSRAMARDPADRFQDLEAMVQALEPFATGHPAPNGTRNARVSPHDGSERDMLMLDTPLASESKPSLPMVMGNSKGLVWMVGAAMVAVVGLGFFVAKLLPKAPSAVAADRDSSPSGARSPTETPTRNAAAAASSGSTVDAAVAENPGLHGLAASPDEPHPNTIRVVPEPAEQPRAWQPAPGQPTPGQPAPGLEHTADRVQGVPERESPSSALPGAADLRRERHASHTDDERSRHRKARASDDRSPSGPSAQPAAPGSKEPAGRLGIRMGESEF